MNIKPIKTENDYKAALIKIDELVDCPENSDGENYLEVLSILLEDYERRHYPVDGIDSVEVINSLYTWGGVYSHDLQVVGI